MCCPGCLFARSLGLAVREPARDRRRQHRPAFLQARHFYALSLERAFVPEPVFLFSLHFCIAASRFLGVFFYSFCLIIMISSFLFVFILYTLLHASEQGLEQESDPLLA